MDTRRGATLVSKLPPRLQAVQKTFVHREMAAEEFNLALAQAHPEHSYREIASVCGLTYEGVRYIVRREQDKP